MRSKFVVLAFALAALTMLMAPARAETTTPLNCRPNDYMVGVGARIGNWINKVYPVCAHFNPGTADFGPAYPGDAYGDEGGAPPVEDRCGPRNLVVHVESKQRNDSGPNNPLPPRKMQYVAFDCMPALFLLNRDTVHHGVTSTVEEDGPGGASRLPAVFSDCLAGQAGIGLDATTFPGTDNPFAAEVKVKCGPVPQAETIGQLPAGTGMNVNYYGSDLPQSGAMSVNDPSLCYQQCVANSACLAWTYVHPGIQGPSAMCYLKNPLPTASKSACCISGVMIARRLPLTSVKDATLHRLHP